MKAFVVRSKDGKYFCADAASSSQQPPCAGCGMRVGMFEELPSAQLYPTSVAAREACSKNIDDGDNVVEIEVSVSNTRTTSSLTHAGKKRITPLKRKVVRR